MRDQYTDKLKRTGRWRSLYLLKPSSSSLSGSIKVDVHYFEDGNVRMLTNKSVSLSASSGSASDIVRQIATAEKKYQEDLNRAFTNLSEGAFKGLRRQLPVTRQKVEWEKISGYRVSRQSALHISSRIGMLTTAVGTRHWRWAVAVVPPSGYTCRVKDLASVCNGNNDFVMTLRNPSRHMAFSRSQQCYLACKAWTWPSYMAKTNLHLPSILHMCSPGLYFRHLHAPCWDVDPWHEVAHYTSGSASPLQLDLSHLRLATTQSQRLTRVLLLRRSIASTSTTYQA